MNEWINFDINSVPDDVVVKETITGLIDVLVNDTGPALTAVPRLFWEVDPMVLNEAGHGENEQEQLSCAEFELRTSIISV